MSPRAKQVLKEARANHPEYKFRHRQCQELEGTPPRFIIEAQKIEPKGRWTPLGVWYDNEKDIPCNN